MHRLKFKFTSLSRLITIYFAKHINTLAQRVTQQILEPSPSESYHRIDILDVGENVSIREVPHVVFSIRVSGCPDRFAVFGQEVEPEMATRNPID
jgi:hypothetical protein